MIIAVIILTALLTWAVAHILRSRPADEFRPNSNPRALTIAVSTHAIERAEERYPGQDVTAHSVAADVALALAGGRRGAHAPRSGGGLRRVAGEANTCGPLTADGSTSSGSASSPTSSASSRRCRASSRDRAATRPPWRGPSGRR